MSYEHSAKRKNSGWYKWDFQDLVICLCKCEDPLNTIWAVYSILIFFYISLFIPKNFVEHFWSQRIWKHQIGATTSEVERPSFLTWKEINYPAACREKSGEGALKAWCDVPMQMRGFFKLCVDALAKPRATHLTHRTLTWAQLSPGLCEWIESRLQVTKPSIRHDVHMLNLLIHVHVCHCFCSVLSAWGGGQ